jgi:carbon monoxide dehydrogenase subunit G
VSYAFDGDFLVATSREEAFEVLSKAPRFAPIMPTYKSHEEREDGSALVRVKVGVGKVRGTGEVILVLEECVEPVRAAYSGKGKVMGGVFNLKAGFDLEEVGPNETRVRWQGEMAIFGKLVSLAGGMVKPIAERDIRKLIDALQAEMGGVVEVPIAAPGVFARLWAWLKGLFSSSPSDTTEN